MTGDTVIAREAVADASAAVANTLVRALRLRMQVIRIDHISHPSSINRTGSERAVRSSPLRKTIETGVAVAVEVDFASSVIGAVVLAEASLTMSSLVPGHLAPRLGLVSWSARGSRGRLAAGRRGRLNSGAE